MSAPNHGEGEAVNPALGEGDETARQDTMTKAQYRKLKRSGRTVLQIHRRVFVFRSEHPLEERIIELTDDYRDANGEYILPEPVAWDGVETCPGVFIGAPDDEEP